MGEQTLRNYLPLSIEARLNTHGKFKKYKCVLLQIVLLFSFTETSRHTNIISSCFMFYLDRYWVEQSNVFHYYQKRIFVRVYYSEFAKDHSHANDAEVFEISIYG